MPLVAGADELCVLLPDCADEEPPAPEDVSPEVAPPELLDGASLLEALDEGTSDETPEERAEVNCELISADEDAPSVKVTSPPAGFLWLGISQRSSWGGSGQCVCGSRGPISARQVQV